MSDRPRLPLADEPARQLAHCDGEVCITCSDQAVQVQVVRLLDADLAIVATNAGTREQVSVALVDAAPGDTILVHAKEAIAVVRR
jgi:hydrogenase expression/formation protein HypC